MAFRCLRRFWKQLFVIAVPLIFLPLPLLIATKPACCAYVIAVMGVFWLSEVVPMAVVSLLPVILLPLLGVQTSKDVCRNYFKDSVMLFVGSLIVAVAVEESNLHKRMALRVLMLVGSKPRWLMLGFMCISGFLSMWMSNTATTAMITPITEAVVLELFKRKRNGGSTVSAITTAAVSPGSVTGHYLKASAAKSARTSYAMSSLSLNPLLLNGDTHSERDLEHAGYDNVALDEKSAGDAEAGVKRPAEPFSIKDLTPDELHIAKGLVLCVAYAANIGGTATLTGTLPNIVFKGQIDVLYGPATGVNFATFLLYSLPGTVLTLFAAFLWMQWVFIAKCTCRRNRNRNTALEDEDNLRNSVALSQTIRDKYAELGPMGFGETSVLCLFIALVASWMFRSPQFVPGWEIFFPKGYVTDATPAILISFLFFIWPSRLWSSKTDQETTGKVQSAPTILTWKSMKRKFPWDVFLLLGGAIALADGTQASGLTEWLKDQMHHFSVLPPWAIVIVISLLIATVTEFASNGAIATIFLPVLAKLAEVSDVNPLYFMIPATIACSFAFMLPVATPPNAIAFGCGYVKVWDMIKAGAMLNIIAIFLLVVNVHTMGVWVFDLLNKPEWLLAAANGDLSRSAYNLTRGH
ncbi:Solute carrier family 13 member 2 [Hypsibius exemplaris]|uniref:Solute carrier family 13 member 2 n=1 Tax=Hypsibius exemplaris TaxID=2072580 RepID=A0A1W0X2N2_HYPEX|nr:Solute carrier family 13 member 2 [Hypsibius exemplaris]